MNPPERPSYPCNSAVCHKEISFHLGKVRGTNADPDRPCMFCCQTCKDLDRAAVIVAHNDIQLKIAMDRQFKHIDEYHCGKNKPREGNGKHKGRWAFTLTCSPNDKLSEQDMIKACRKIMAQKSCPVKFHAWHVEYRNQEEMTGYHIHGMYETYTGGRIEAKHWKRAWPIWDEKAVFPNNQGFRGGYHRPVELDEAYVRYIKKQDGYGESKLP